MLLFAITVVVALVVMLAMAIYMDQNRELRLGRAVVILVVAMVPLVNVLVALVCLVRFLVEVLFENKGAVIFRWKKQS